MLKLAHPEEGVDGVNAAGVNAALGRAGSAAAAAAAAGGAGAGGPCTLEPGVIAAWHELMELQSQVATARVKAELLRRCDDVMQPTQEPSERRALERLR